MEDQSEKIDSATRLHNVQQVAQVGFGNNAAAYDEHRPGYTGKSIEEILKEIVLPKEISRDSLEYEILELGAGTGKLTELVAPKIIPGYRYLATEPSLSFIEVLRLKGLPIDTKNASASMIPLPNNSVQNILCGQCLHWFCDEDSLKEIHRVLVPGGKLIALSNVKRYEEEWMVELYKQRFEVMARTGSSTMFMVSTMEWKKAVDATGLFTESRHETLPGIESQRNLDSILDHLRTVSCYNALSDDERETYLEQLRKNILAYPNIDPDNMIMPFKSLLYVFKANDHSASHKG